MEVRSGWNTEMGRKKFDVTIQEPDLWRMLAANGIPPDRASDLTSGEAFQVMWLEAEIVAKATLVIHLEGQDDLRAAENVKQENKELRQKRADAFAALRSRLGL